MRFIHTNRRATVRYIPQCALTLQIVMRQRCARCRAVLCRRLFAAEVWLQGGGTHVEVAMSLRGRQRGGAQRAAAAHYTHTRHCDTDTHNYLYYYCTEIPILQDQT